MKKIFLLLGLCLLTGCGEKKENLVLAFYYPWYGTPDISGEWRHWSEGGHNPDYGKGETRDTGTSHHPYPDVYDSSSEEVIERHLRTAERCGIDGLIVSWWGKGTFEDKVFKKMFEVAERKKFKIKLSVYYEEIPEKRIDGVVEDLYYLSEFFERENFLKWNSRPVIFVYGRAIIPGWSSPMVSWKKAIDSFPEVIFSGDLTAYFLSSILIKAFIKDGFSGIHIYNPLLDILFIGDIGSLYGKFVGTGRSQNVIPALTVIPGYDDRNIGRENPHFIDRKDGELYREFWEKALIAKPDWILITSFNEWHEGTEIEESYEFGDRYIKITEEFAGRFKGENF